MKNTTIFLRLSDIMKVFKASMLYDTLYMVSYETPKPAERGLTFFRNEKGEIKGKVGFTVGGTRTVFYFNKNHSEYLSTLNECEIATIERDLLFLVKEAEAVSLSHWTFLSLIEEIGESEFVLWTYLAGVPCIIYNDTRFSETELRSLIRASQFIEKKERERKRKKRDGRAYR